MIIPLSVVCLLLAMACASSSAVDAPSGEPRVVGLEQPCRDLDRAAHFYCGALGYRVLERDRARAVLALGDVRLVLDTGRATGGRSNVYLNHRVADLDAATAVAVSAGGRVLGPAGRFALGQARPLADPDGNFLQLVRLDEEPDLDALPAVFNLSVRGRDVAPLESFFCGELGFAVFSRDYLPRTLPLQRHGVVALVLHDTASEAALQSARPGARILLAGATPRVWRGPDGVEVATAGDL